MNAAKKGRENESQSVSKKSVTRNFQVGVDGNRLISNGWESSSSLSIKRFVQIVFVY